jgi:hypothetical protein
MHFFPKFTDIPSLPHFNSISRPQRSTEFHYFQIITVPVWIVQVAKVSRNKNALKGALVKIESEKKGGGY